MPIHARAYDGRTERPASRQLVDAAGAASLGEPGRARIRVRQLLDRETLSTAELDSFGRSAASALGGEPYGTLNLDFSGSVPSLEMLVDLSRC